MLDAEGEREGRVNWLCGSLLERKGSVKRDLEEEKVGERGIVASWIV